MARPRGLRSLETHLPVSCVDSPSTLGLPLHGEEGRGRAGRQGEGGVRMWASVLGWCVWCTFYR